MKKKSTRYLTIERGIRKDLRNNNFLASKYSPEGRKISQQFSKISDARRWRLANVSVNDKKEGRGQLVEELWLNFKREKVSQLEESTQQNYCNRLYPFIKSILLYNVYSIDNSVISNLLIEWKRKHKRLNSKKCNFDKELKMLSSMFNWYRELFEPSFVNPISRQHRKMGFIKEPPKRNKKMTEEQIKRFLNGFSYKSMWYDFAYLQFFLAARVQEIAGLQKSSLSLKEGKGLIDHAIVWDSGNKKFLKLRKTTKNGESKAISITPTLKEVFKRRIEESKDDHYLFTFKGKPLDYRKIQYEYKKALDKAGLSNEFSGTHFLRHSMATLTRKTSNNLDAVQAITGHKDIRMAQHYAELDYQLVGSATMKVEEHLGFSKKCANSEQMEVLEEGA